jgi:patatin-like phospholipase/acyl hydrolase
MAESSEEKPYRVLTLDGGGAKGFYTLGVLREIEALVGMPLHGKFDLIFGTSTGAIIAAMLALGHSVEEIHGLYKKHVVTVMACETPAEKTAALKALATEVFEEQTFEDVKTGIGIVTTKWINDRPMVFKASKDQAHGRQGTFKPGFGCTIADAVQASCSAYPFFEKKRSIPHSATSS